MTLVHSRHQCVYITPSQRIPDLIAVFGLGLMVDLVAAGALTQRRAVAIAHQIQASNPLHINEHVLARFLAAPEEL